MHIFILLAMLAMCTSCTKNSFSSEGEIGASEMSTLEAERQEEEHKLELKELMTNPYYKAHIKQAIDGNLYSPAGNNAVESLLKARSSFPDSKEQIETAIRDLQQNVIIGTEAAIGRGDTEEAERLLSIIKIMNDGETSIPRLTEEIKAKKIKIFRLDNTRVE